MFKEIPPNFLFQYEMILHKNSQNIICSCVHFFPLSNKKNTALIWGGGGHFPLKTFTPQKIGGRLGEDVKTGGERGFLPMKIDAIFLSEFLSKKFNPSELFGVNMSVFTERLFLLMGKVFMETFSSAQCYSH